MLKLKSGPVALFWPQIGRSTGFWGSVGGVGTLTRWRTPSWWFDHWFSGQRSRNLQKDRGRLQWSEISRKKRKGKGGLVGHSLSEARRPRAKGGLSLTEARLQGGRRGGTSQRRRQQISFIFIVLQEEAIRPLNRQTLGYMDSNSRKRRFGRPRELWTPLGRRLGLGEGVLILLEAQGDGRIQLGTQIKVGG